MSKIITHPGVAHFDDLLSVALVIAKIKDIEKVERREPNPEEINNPDIWKLDIGGDYNPELKLFDHHQEDLRREDCTFSLLLKEWELWEDAVEVYPELKACLIRDISGTDGLKNYFNISTKAISLLYSHIERVILKRFQRKNSIENKSFDFSLLQMIGYEFFRGIESYKKLKDTLKNKVQIELIDDIPFIKCLELKPSQLLTRLMNQLRKDLSIQGGVLVYINEWDNNKISLRRTNDENRIDFNNIKSYEKTHFIHKNGFFAVVNKMEDDDLREYLEATIINS